MKRTFPLAQDSFTSDEITSVIEVLKSGNYSGGEKVRQFEASMASWVGAKHALMVNSGSSVHLLLVASLLYRTHNKTLLRAGDEVLVSALSSPTTVWPIVQLGLKPVFVDIDPATLALGLTSAKRAVTNRTRAMFLTHVLGIAADMKACTEFCEREGLILIEDAGGSLGAYFEEKHVGTFGYGASFSHHFSQHLNTVEGGTITTDDSELYEDLKSLRAYGSIRDRSDRLSFEKKHPELDPRSLLVLPGFNVQPTELQAAIGLTQLEKMDEFLVRRHNLAIEITKYIQQYTPALRVVGAEFLEWPDSKFNRRHSFLNIPIVADKGLKLSAQEIKAELEAFGIETRALLYGNICRHPASESLGLVPKLELPECDIIHSQGFMIGCPAIYEEADLDYLKDAFEQLGAKL